MSTSIDLLSFSPPPSSMLSRTQFSFTLKPTFLLSSKKESFFTLRASAADNGAGVSAPAVTVEEPKVREASEGPTESNGAVEAPEVKAVNKFEDPKWVNGTWDLKQFQKNGQTDWDAVIDAGEVSGFFFFLGVDGLFVYVVKSMITSEERGSFCFNLFDFYCSLFGC